MATFSSNVSNDGNKLVTLLGSQTSIIQEFVQQSGKVAIEAIVDTLMIEFD